MEKTIKEAALWLAFFAGATVFCYGFAAIMALVCSWI